MNKLQLIYHLQFILGESFDKYSLRDEIAFLKNKGLEVPYSTIADLLKDGIVEEYQDTEYFICDKEYSKDAVEIDGYYYIVNTIEMYRWVI